MTWRKGRSILLPTPQGSRAAVRGAGEKASNDHVEAEAAFVEEVEEEEEEEEGEEEEEEGVEHVFRSQVWNSLEKGYGHVDARLRTRVSSSFERDVSSTDRIHGSTP